MRRLLTTVVFGLLGLLGLPLCSAPALAQRPERELLNALAKELGCAKTASTAGLRVWCLGPRAFKTGRQPVAPGGSRALLGVTVELQRGKSIRQALLQKVHLSALALRQTGGRMFGKITGIRPSNEAEKRSLARAVFGVSAVLKGRARHVVIDKSLHGYINSLPRRAAYPIRPGKTGWRMSGASEAQIRQLGALWISVEVPKAQDGIFLSLFTARVATR